MKTFQERQTEFETSLTVGSEVNIRFLHAKKLMTGVARIAAVNDASYEVRLSVPVLLHRMDADVLPEGHWMTVRRLGTPEDRVEPLGGY